MKTYTMLNGTSIEVPDVRLPCLTDSQWVVVDVKEANDKNPFVAVRDLAGKWIGILKGKHETPCKCAKSVYVWDNDLEVVVFYDIAGQKQKNMQKAIDKMFDDMTGQERSNAFQNIERLDKMGVFDKDKQERTNALGYMANLNAPVAVKKSN